MIMVDPHSQTKIIYQDKDFNAAVCVSLIADTQAEVTDGITGADVEGLSDTDIIGFGSTVFTNDVHYAKRNSDNATWSWMA